MHYKNKDSVGYLIDFLSVYCGLQIAHEVIFQGDGKTIMYYGKLFATYHLEDNSGIPIFKFKNEYYNSAQEQKRVDAIREVFGYPKFTQPKIFGFYLDKIFFIGTFKYKYPFTRDECVLDCYFNSDTMKVLSFDSDGNMGSINLFGNKEHEVEKDAIANAWAIIRTTKNQSKLSMINNEIL